MVQNVVRPLPDELGVNASMLKLDHFTAQREEYFADHWIATPAFERATRLEKPIIFGAKGCGKSALARYLVDMRGDTDIICRHLDLTQLQHGRIVSQLKLISDKLLADNATLLANYWRHLFLLHFLREVSIAAESLDDSSATALQRVREVLDRPEPQSEQDPIGYTILSYIAKCIRAFEEALISRTNRDDPPVINGLTRKELAMLEQYPSDDRFVDACLVAAGLLAKIRRHICIVVDGLDRAGAKDRKAHPIVLGSIVHAVKRLALDSALSGVLSIKILVPRELFFALPDRDLDQYVTLQTHLSWDPGSLRQLIERRILAAVRRTKTLPVEVDAVMARSLPDGSDALGYMIRHCMYRPRQLLYYVQTTLENASGPTATGHDVIRSVKSASSDLCRYFIQENHFKYPALRRTLEGLAGLSSVVTLATLLQRLPNRGQPTVDMLYDCGALGIIEETPEWLPPDPSGCTQTIGGTARQISCEFIYKPGARSYVLPGLPPETLVTLHPMLHAHFGIVPAQNFVTG